MKYAKHVSTPSLLSTRARQARKHTKYVKQSKHESTQVRYLVDWKKSFFFMKVAFYGMLSITKPSGMQLNIYEKRYDLPLSAIGNELMQRVTGIFYQTLHLFLKTKTSFRASKISIFKKKKTRQTKLLNTSTIYKLYKTS